MQTKEIVGARGVNDEEQPGDAGNGEGEASRPLFVFW
jgi:hypothetical protein